MDSLCDRASVFAPLPRVAGGFACAAIDFPRHFETWSPKGQGRSPSRHYSTHQAKAISDLLLTTVLARDAWLFLWWPDPASPEVLEVMRSLGFDFSAKAFTWIKTLPSLARGPRLISTDEIECMLPIGGGHTTRKNSESC